MAGLRRHRRRRDDPVRHQGHRDRRERDHAAGRHLQDHAVRTTPTARQATLLFEPGTDATMELPNGQTKPLGDLEVRATEYTVGADGEERMPGELPDSSAYTYAVEFSVDEAVEAGATDVKFTKPVTTYVDNFLGFKAGTIVPSAYYDEGKGAWVPSENGLVIKIVSESDGRANVDTDGDGNADNAGHRRRRAHRSSPSSTTPASRCGASRSSTSRPGTTTGPTAAARSATPPTRSRPRRRTAPSARPPARSSASSTRRSARSCPSRAPRSTSTTARPACPATRRPTGSRSR